MVKEKIQAQVERILQQMANPFSGRTLYEENALEKIEEEKGRYVLYFRLPDDKRFRFQVEAQIRTHLASFIPPDRLKFKINYYKPQESPPTKRKLPGVDTILAIASGKGGVGKSSIALHLSYTLVEEGFRVGLLDGDIYGPSIGKMIGIRGKFPLEVEEKILPLEKGGLKIVSFSFLLEEGQPVIWRGPILGRALEQLFWDVDWGNLDYLIVDLPPGTGDIQLSLSQVVHTDGAILVITPQEVALIDAERAGAMLQKVGIPLKGVVENMSYFLCPHCGERSYIFSKGGGKKLAEKFQIPLLGEIPFVPAFMQIAEEGKTLSESKDPSLKEVHKAFQDLAKNLREVLG